MNNTHEFAPTLEDVQRIAHRHRIGFRVAGDTLLGGGGEDVQTVIGFSSQAALVRAMSQPDSLTLGELYITGELDVTGELPTALRFFADVAALCVSAHTVSPLTQAPEGNLPNQRVTREQARSDIAYHYNLPVEFWSRWLDQRLQYTCAIFKSEQDSLDAAQRHKLDVICRKLNLKPGHRLLDIGCGWGGLVMHAVEHFGVSATGVTLSERQAEFAQREIRQRNLTDRCQIMVADYRDLDSSGTYDAISAVGVLEHIGDDQLDVFFRTSHALLSDGGSLLVQAIVHGRREGFLPRSTEFIDQHVFPGHQLSTLGRLLQHAERAGFEVMHTENLRRHYELTVRLWARQLEVSRESLLEARIIDEVTFRRFVLYLHAVNIGFSQGHLGIFQSLVWKPADGLPPGPLRQHVVWYDGAPGKDDNV